MADAAFAIASVAVSCFLPAPRLAGTTGRGTLRCHSVESDTIRTNESSSSTASDKHIGAAANSKKSMDEGSNLASDAAAGVTGVSSATPSKERFRSTPQTENPSQTALRRSNEAPLRVSLLISLLLFSLGIIEALPSSWLMFLNNHAQKGHAMLPPARDPSSEIRGFALSSAYRFLLWIDCVFIAVIVPGALGAVLIMRFIPRGSKEDGGKARRHKRDCSRVGGGIIRALCIAQSLTEFITSIILIVCGFLVKVVRKSVGKGPNHPRGLPTTTSESIISCTSGNTKVSDATQYSKRGLVFGSILGLSCSFLSLRALGRFVNEIDNEMENTIALKRVVAQICALGVIISSVLGAFGSVSMPYTCLMGFFLPHISDHSIKALQKELQSLSQSLAELQSRRILSLPGPGLPSPVATSASASRGRGLSYFRKSCSSLSRAHLSSGIQVDEYQAAAMREEIDFLQNLHADISEELFEMRQMQIQSKRSRTPLGRIRGFFGIIFSVVLLVRVGMIAFGPRAGDNYERSDPITIGLSVLLGFSMIDEVEYNTLQQLSSLFLSAFLSVSQVNMFLRTLGTLDRRVWCLWRSCRNDFVVRDWREKQCQFTSATSWLLSGIMGSFFLSCLVLIKKSVPRDYRASFSSALKGSGDFSFDARITNSVFTFSALFSAATLGILFGIRRKTSKFHLTPQFHGTNMHIDV
jgi:hypothetical protein